MSKSQFLDYTSCWAGWACWAFFFSFLNRFYFLLVLPALAVLNVSDAVAPSLAEGEEDRGVLRDFRKSSLFINRN